jgi:putative transcriptional regulator
MTQSLVGNLLVASTLVTDSVFARGVCLMMHHDDQGAIAVMLNRPIWPPPAELIKLIKSTGDVEKIEAGESTPAGTSPTHRLKKFIQPTNDQSPGAQQNYELSVSKAGGEVTVPDPAAGMIHFGGPLSGPVLAIHASQSLAEAQTGHGIYVAAQKEHLEQILLQNPSQYRLIVGHSAWGSGQLDAEIKAGAWHVLPATAELIFGTADDLWPLLIRRGTGSTLARLVGAPDNPRATALN